MATRKAPIKVEKMEVPAILEMIAKSTDSGFGVPANIIISLSSKKTLANMFDTGLIELHTSSTFGGWYYYTITEAGRKAN